MEPIKIKKSTPVAAIKAMFKTTEALLERFTLAKNQASAWDGERDGLREAVKEIPAGKYGKITLTKYVQSEVMYPNADGKYQLDSTIQTTVPISDTEPGTRILIVLDTPAIRKKLSPELLIGAGVVVDNAKLYENKAATKCDLST